MMNEILFKSLGLCALLPFVRREVIKNHDDNLWWPLSVTDWRLRMAIAGWSTRISYKMISTYQSVVGKVNHIGYERICSMPNEELSFGGHISYWSILSVCTVTKGLLKNVP